MRVSGTLTERDHVELERFGRWLKRVKELENAGVKNARSQACTEVYGNENCRGVQE